MTGTVPPVVASRRPPVARVGGFAVLLAAVSWALGAFSAWPLSVWEGDAALLRVSLRHVPGFLAAVETRSAEEIARLAPHMRPSDPARPTTGRRAEGVLTVTIGGREVLARTYQPTGFRRDGPVYAYEEIEVPPGSHLVRVTLADRNAAGGGRQWSFEQVLTFRNRGAPLVEYGDARGWRAE